MDDAGLAKQGGTAEAEPFVPDRTEGSLFFSLSAGRRGSGRRGDGMPEIRQYNDIAAVTDVAMLTVRRAWRDGSLATPREHPACAALLLLLHPIADRERTPS